MSRAPVATMSGSDDDGDSTPMLTEAIDPSNEDPAPRTTITIVETPDAVKHDHQPHVHSHDSEDLPTSPFGHRFANVETQAGAGTLMGRIVDQPSSELDFDPVHPSDAQSQEPIVTPADDGANVALTSSPHAQADDAMYDAEKEPMSTPLNTEGVADEVASRTVIRSGVKRKAHELEDLSTTPNSRLKKTRREAGVEGTDDVTSTETTSKSKSGRKSQHEPKPAKSKAEVSSSSGNRAVQSKPPPTQRSSSPPATPPDIPPKVLLSHTGYQNKVKDVEWLTVRGAKVIHRLPAAKVNFICVVGVSQRLPTTAKVLHAITLGKQVVTDAWIANSLKAGKLLKTDVYIHKALAATMDIDRSTLFVGKTLFFTILLYRKYGKADWANVEALGRETGATRIEKGSAAKALKLADQDNVVLLGHAKGDADVEKLLADGRVVYRKELFAESIVRGKLELADEEFMIDMDGQPMKAQAKPKAKAKTKAKGKKR